jgi:hypothetical protein
VGLLNTDNVTVTNNELDIPVGIYHADGSGASLRTYILGDYTIEPEFGGVTPDKILPLDWMGQIYSNYVFENVDLANYKKKMLGFDMDYVGTAYVQEGSFSLGARNGIATGVTFRSGLNTLGQTNSNAVQRKKRTIHSWFEDGLGNHLTVRRRAEVLAGQSPWNKASGTEGGYSRTAYVSTDLQKQDDAARRSLMKLYQTTTVGLTNELFRTYQTVN